MKIDLPVQRWAGWDTVSAELVDIASHLPRLPWSFAVHRCTWYGAKWCVTNLETGAYAGLGKTRALAIKNAKDKCASLTERHLATAVRKQCESYFKSYGVRLDA